MILLSIYIFVHLSNVSLAEFQPGVPWKGIPNIDPESDPYVTPGSVLGGPAPSPIVDTDHQLLQDTPTGLSFWSCFIFLHVIYVIDKTKKLSFQLSILR